MNFLARYFYFIASIVLTAYALIASKAIINPLLSAFILALALHPVARSLELIKIPRLLSTIICVSLFIIVILTILIFFSWKVGTMDFEMDSISDSFGGGYGELLDSITNALNISVQEQASMLKEFYTKVLENSVTVFNNTFFHTTNFLTAFVIFALSLVFILYYRVFLLSFLFKVVPSNHHLKLKVIIKKTQSVVVHYVFGILLIIMIVATLNTLGLVLLGINNAIMFGIMAAILTLIPYIGILIGSLLPALFALFTKDSLWYPVGVMAVFMFVQFIEGNFLEPHIVGRQVSLNPFAAIIGLTSGWMLLGITGIIFALPGLAIVKVICDEIPPLKPIGYLLGDKTHLYEETNVQ